MNVTDAVAVGLNLDHVKLLNAATIVDMDPSCCSFHTNSPKIPVSLARRGPRAIKFRALQSLSKPPSRRRGNEAFIKYQPNGIVKMLWFQSACNRCWRPHVDDLACK